MCIEGMVAAESDETELLFKKLLMAASAITVLFGKDVFQSLL